MDQSAVQQFQSLPAPVKAVVALTSGMGLLGALQLATGNAAVVGIVAAGLVGVAALLVAYKFLLGWLRKRKAAPLERAVLDNSSAAPNSISEPARRARLDDLRKSFESGVEKFKAAGKDLYSLPWYLLVGEPGSGKTEAVRHCNVGFPPGLQDQLQGAGGTLNMNWWFTNQAIILDTAGRLMFEDVAPGTTSEWNEFLKLLLRIRPNCPVNGLLLVLPADSLLRDKADEIEKKAGKIAQQLDSIQRALGVRFPVFIIVTKSDLITGFREYFDNLNDPQLQHQILGWSNAAPLDQPFAPEAVENHIKGVSQKLARRRQGLLLDPVHTEDANHRRLDQVDALYAFPESLLQITPRLRRYLEMIFVAGEWSPKPLFLRGIYFTSSMREGADIDVEVARILNVAPEALPGGGKVWERDRAFFLRDLFVNKVFREKGLVTRASDTARLQRRRKAIVLGAGFASVLLLLALTWWGKHEFEKRVGGEGEYWATLDRKYRDAPSGKWNVISPRTDVSTAGPISQFRYDGGAPTDLPDKTSRAQVHDGVAEKLKERLDPPRIFRPMQVIQEDVETSRRDAGRSLYEASVLRPVLDAARRRLDADRAGEQWTDRATAALGQLVRLESYAAGAAPATSEAHGELHLDPLLRYVLEEKDYGEYAGAHKDSLQQSLKKLYADQAAKWPPEGLAGGGGHAKLLTHAVAAFRAHWKGQYEGRAPRLVAIGKLADALRAFEEAEKGLANAVSGAPVTVRDFEDLERRWKTHYATLVVEKRRADDAVAELGVGWKDGVSAVDLFEHEVADAVAKAQAAHQALLGQFPAAEAEGSKADGARVQLGEVRREVAQSLQAIPQARQVVERHELRERLKALDQFYLAKGEGLDGADHRRYAIHFQVYAKANGVLEAPFRSDGEWKLNTFEDGLKEIDGAAEAAVGAIEPVQRRASGERVTGACTTAGGMIDIVSRERRLRAIRLTLAGAPEDRSALAKAIADVPDTERGDAVAIPFTRLDGQSTYAREYRPRAAGAFLRGWKAMAESLAPLQPGAAPRVLHPESVAPTWATCDAAVAEYAEDYLEYWTRGLRDALTVRTSWADFARQSPRVRVHEIMTGLVRVSEDAVAALTEGERSVPRKAVDGFTEARLGARPPGRTSLAPLQNTCEDVFAAWRSLGDDPVRARRQLLALAPAAFRNTYLAVEGGGGVKPNLVQWYWQSLGLGLTGAIAEGAKTATETALDDVRGLTRFPLTVPRDGQQPLTVDDVQRVRAKLAGIAIAKPDVRAEDRSIDQGANTGVKDVDDVLEKLRTLELKPIDATFLRRTAALLAALPAAGERFSCSVSVLGQTQRAQYQKEPNLPFGYETWAALALFQDDPAPRPSHTDVKETLPIGLARYPGKPVRFGGKYFVQDNAKFEAFWPEEPKQRPGGAAPAAAPGAAEDEWSLLRLVHLPGARRAGSDRQWHVPVPLPAPSAGNDKEKGKHVFIWVQLDFDRPLPPLDEWPTTGLQR